MYFVFTEGVCIVLKLFLCFLMLLRIFLPVFRNVLEPDMRFTLMEFCIHPVFVSVNL